MAITKLESLIEIVQKKARKKVIVAFGQDETTILATKRAHELRFAEFTLVGDEEVIKKVCANHDINPSIYNIIHEPDEMESGKKSIAMVKEGLGDVLMKGLISTDNLLKCMLDKEDGVMLPNSLLSHISIAEIPNYHKLIIFTDAAFVPRPNIDQKIAMTRYVIDTARKIGIKRPKVAIISFSEKTNPKAPTSVDAAFISKMADRNQIRNADIDGPLSIDLAIDPVSLKYKGVTSCVEANADCLVFPFLEAANIFYKTLTYFANADMATYIVGTHVPITLSSRSDTVRNKLYSLAFTCLMAQNPEGQE
jgi:phosphate butyryltransferase